MSGGCSVIVCPQCGHQHRFHFARGECGERYIECGCGVEMRFEIDETGHVHACLDFQAWHSATRPQLRVVH